MPTYAYACTECEHRFDIVQTFSDDALTECPECSGRLRKLFNAVGVVFKGSGFYRTDSRSSGSGAPTSSSSAAKGSTSGSSSTSPSDAGASSSSSGGSSGSSSASTSSAASGASSTSG